jgi:hypothetical protein
MLHNELVFEPVRAGAERGSVSRGTSILSKSLRVTGPRSRRIMADHEQSQVLKFETLFTDSFAEHTTAQTQYREARERSRAA